MARERREHMPVRWERLLRETYQYLAAASGRPVSDIVREALWEYAGPATVKAVKAKVAATQQPAEKEKAAGADPAAGA